jgi:hypothetical protein
MGGLAASLLYRKHAGTHYSLHMLLLMRASDTSLGLIGTRRRYGSSSGLSAEGGIFPSLASD